MGPSFDLLQLPSEQLYTIFESGSRDRCVRESAASSGRIVKLYRSSSCRGQAPSA